METAGSELGVLNFVSKKPKEKEPWHHRTLHFKYCSPENAVDKLSVDVGKVVEETVHEALISRVASVFLKIRSITVWAHRRSEPHEVPTVSTFFKLNDQNDAAQTYSSKNPRVSFTTRGEQRDRILSGRDSSLLLVEIEKPPELDMTVTVDILWHAILEGFSDWLPWFRRTDRALSQQDLSDHVYELRSRYGKCTDLEFAEALGHHSKKLWDKALDLESPSTYYLPDDYTRKIRKEVVTRGDMVEYHKQLFQRHRDRFQHASVQRRPNVLRVSDPAGEVITRQTKLAEIRRSYQELFESGVIGEEARKFYCDYPLSEEAIDAISTQWWSDIRAGLSEDDLAKVNEDLKEEPNRGELLNEMLNTRLLRLDESCESLNLPSDPHWSDDDEGEIQVYDQDDFSSCLFDLGERKDNY